MGTLDTALARTGASAENPSRSARDRCLPARLCGAVELSRADATVVERARLGFFGGAAGTAVSSAVDSIFAGSGGATGGSGSGSGAVRGITVGTI